MNKVLLFSVLILLQITSCNSKKYTQPVVDESNIVKNVEETIYKIFDACKNKNFLKLESYHINTSKFSIFKEDGSRERLSAKQNNQVVQNELSSLEDAIFNVSDLKIDVIRQVAVATFILDIKASIQNTAISGSNRTTFVFVEDEGSWKVLHEHFSPVAVK